jgi:hypothetical protein
MQTAAAPVEVQANIRKRIAIGMMLSIGTGIILSQWALTAWSSPQVGWDFPAFYIAGRLPLRLLYSPAAFASFWQQHLAPIGVPHYSYYMRPPVFAFLLHPIARLPYYQASWLWLGAGLCAYLITVGLLIRRFQLPSFLLPAYACFFPAVVGIISGQDTAFLFLALVLALLFLEQKRDMLGGIFLTACLCKFNLVFLMAFLLPLQRRFRAFIAFGLGAAFVSSSSVCLTSVREYATAIIQAPRRTPGFFPVGLRGFSTAIGLPDSYPILAIVTLTICLWLMRRLPFTEAFCVATTGALLISPYITWYDSTLLALPLAAIFARSGLAVRVACMIALVAVPLWRYGGGNNGPIGFTHVGVEVLILSYFVWIAYTHSHFGGGDIRHGVPLGSGQDIALISDPWRASRRIPPASALAVPPEQHEQN